jgi:hypothetical protein
LKTSLVGTEHENILPFATQTVASLGGERLNFRESELTFLRVLYDEDAKELSELSRKMELADDLKSEIVQYSLELLRIAEMNGSEQDRVAEYVVALGAIGDRTPFQLDIEPTVLNAIVASIREQETLLAALRKADPLIERAGEQFDALAQQIEEQELVAAVQYLDSTIQQHFAVFLEFNAAMVERRDELLEGFTLVGQYRRGDSSAATRLRELNVILNKDIAVPDALTESQLARIEGYLLSEAQRDKELIAFLAVDVDAYLGTRVELEREEAEVLAALNAARLQVVAWTRSHQAMADGVKNPGTWLEVAMQAAQQTKQLLN